MAINIKNLQERIQKKVFSVSPSTPTADLGDIVEAATLATGSLRQYDSAGLLPSVTSTQAQIAYTKKDNAIKHKSANTTTWKTLTTDAYAAGAAAGGGGAATNHQQGETAGYRIGGSTPYATVEVRVDKFAFASSTSGSFVSGLTLSSGRYLTAGTMSPTFGYRHGGSDPSGTPVKLNDIEKFPFASEDAFTDVGNLTESKSFIYGGGTSSPTHGYRHGGWPATNVIDKYSFSADGNATDVGDLSVAEYATGGSHSSTHGYRVGGNEPNDTIEKYSFSSDGNATDVGDLHPEAPNASYLGNNNGSPTHGYQVGGYSPAGRLEEITKFSFSVDGNSTDVGNLLHSGSRTQSMSQASSTDGYIYAHGGNPPVVDIIQRFSYSSDGNSVDAGDLAIASHNAAGVHN